MKQKINNLYVFQVWVTSIILAPLLILIIFFVGAINFGLDYGGIIGFLLISITLAGLLSIPTLIVCDFILMYLRTKPISPFYIRLGISIISIVGVFITFYLLFNGDIFESKQAFTFPLIYSISIVFSSLIFNPNAKNIS